MLLTETEDTPQAPVRLSKSSLNSVSSPSSVRATIRVDSAPSYSNLPPSPPTVTSYYRSRTDFAASATDFALTRNVGTSVAWAKRRFGTEFAVETRSVSTVVAT